MAVSHGLQARDGLYPARGQGLGFGVSWREWSSLVPPLASSFEVSRRFTGTGMIYCNIISEADPGFGEKEGQTLMPKCQNW